MPAGENTLPSAFNDSQPTSNTWRGASVIAARKPGWGTYNVGAMPTTARFGPVSALGCSVTLKSMTWLPRRTAMRATSPGCAGRDGEPPTSACTWSQEFTYVPLIAINWSPGLRPGGTLASIACAVAAPFVMLDNVVVAVSAR